MIQRSGVPVDVILECKNGEEALDVLETQQIDVMFTDIRMPRMDGIELNGRKCSIYIKKKRLRGKSTRNVCNRKK